MGLTALCPGTFDPVTNGHIDIIERAARRFDALVVGVLDNPAKEPMFGVEERVDLLKGKHAAARAELRALRKLRILLEPPVKCVDGDVAEVAADLGGGEAAQNLGSVGLQRRIADGLDEALSAVDSLAQLTQAHPPKRLGGDFRFSYHSVSARARVVASGLFVARIKQWVRHPVKARLLFGLSANLCRRRAAITYAGGHAGLRACGARPGRPSADELNFPDRTVFPDFKRSRVRDGTIRIDESAILF